MQIKRAAAELIKYNFKALLKQHSLYDYQIKIYFLLKPTFFF